MIHYTKTPEYLAAVARDSKRIALQANAERMFSDCMLRIAIAGDYFELLMVKLNVWRV